MKNVYIKNTLLHTFYIITTLFLFLISYSKTTNTNPVYLKYIRKLQNPPKYNDYEDMFIKCEQLREKNKNLEYNITKLRMKNKDYELKIEVNKIYITILYILISILLLAIIIIIIVKFYVQCSKKPNIRFKIKEKYDTNFSEKQNEISN